MAKGYRHLTYEQRCQIYALLKRGTSQVTIATMLGTTQPTISREVNRNSGGRGYRYKQAQEKASNKRHKASSLNTKFTSEMKVYVEHLLIKKQWSPEQISGWMKRVYPNETISHERIYQYIWQDKHEGGTLYKHLRQRGKKHNKRGSKIAGRGLIPNRVGIEKRPDIVNSKQRVGDLEVDTIIGSNHNGAILSIVDRKTKLTILSLLPHNTAENVSLAMISSLKSIKDNVHTITSDNGKEFAKHQLIAKELNADFYFAQPYHAWERGVNENTNGLIRQYFPKGRKIATIAPWELKHVEYLLNTRPRKTLNYRTPLEIFFQATGKNLCYALQG